MSFSIVVSSLLFSLLLSTSDAIALPTQAEGPNKTQSSVIFELHFISGAELNKTVNFLRANGISASVKKGEGDIVEVEADSYNKSVEKLSRIVSALPDISKLIWKNGSTDTVLFEAQEAKIAINKDVLSRTQKVLTDFNGDARMTLIIKDDKKSVIKYQSLVKKLENQGYKVTFAEGYRDAGWTEYPAIDISIPNNIKSFSDAILELSDHPEISRFGYNRGFYPHINEFIATFRNGFDMELQIQRFLANGIEVYKIDKTLNRIFFHFPHNEVRNKIKIDQIKDLEDLVILKNIHENNEQFKNEEYAKNLKSVWLDVPETILRGQWKNGDYKLKLIDIAKGEVEQLQAKGMVVVNFGVYEESGEILIPELVFTHLDKDLAKGEEVLREHDKNPYRAPARTKGNSCVALFN